MRSGIQPPSSIIAAHKFKLGRAVFLQPTMGNRGTAVARYEVTKQLPTRDAEFEYRIKSSAELYERAVKESELSAE
jgi:hypothetical protein